MDTHHRLRPAKLSRDRSVVSRPRRLGVLRCRAAHCHRHAARTFSFTSWQRGDQQQATQFAATASSLPIAQVFPASTTDAAVLREAVDRNPQDAHAKYALGNFLFAHARYEEAATLWSAALVHNFENPVLLRNLGVYEWRVKNDLTAAASYYARAIALSP